MQVLIIVRTPDTGREPAGRLGHSFAHEIRLGRSFAQESGRQRPPAAAQHRPIPENRW